MKRSSSSNLARSAGGRVLTERSVSRDPFVQFNAWFKTVLRSKTLQPYAMTLATATANGKPTARIVLLKGVDDRGLTFFTNYESVKGKQLSENPFAALLFYWPQLKRQIRIEGTVERLSHRESVEYFSTRPRKSRIGAWASQQSEVIGGRAVLETRFRKFQGQFRNNDIPLPDFWGGYRLLPTKFEFWQNRPNRLHDRIAYVLRNGLWKIIRLSP